MTALYNARATTPEGLSPAACPMDALRARMIPRPNY
jgi:hypothetical protein